MYRLLFLLAWVPQQAPGEKIEIRVRPVEGDRIETFHTWTNSLRGMLGDELIVVSSRGGRRLACEMARVEGGRPARLVVDVQDSYLEQQDTKTGKFIRKDDAIHGRRVTIERRGGREERAGLDGVPEAESRTLTLDDPLARLFPDKAVAVGESWDIAGEGLKKFFPGGDFNEGRIVVSLRDVKEIDGRRCALLGTNYDVSRKGADGTTFELRLMGTLTVWIDRGYVLAMTQSGGMKVSGADPKTGQPNGETAITGELKATILGKSK